MQTTKSYNGNASNALASDVERAKATLSENWAEIQHKDELLRNQMNNMLLQPLIKPYDKEAADCRTDQDILNIMLLGSFDNSIANNRGLPWKDIYHLTPIQNQGSSYLPNLANIQQDLRKPSMNPRLRNRHHRHHKHHRRQIAGLSLSLNPQVSNSHRLPQLILSGGAGSQQSTIIPQGTRNAPQSQGVDLPFPIPDYSQGTKAINEKLEQQSQQMQDLLFKRSGQYKQEKDAFHEKFEQRFADLEYLNANLAYRLEELKAREAMIKGTENPMFYQQ